MLDHLGIRCMHMAASAAFYDAALAPLGRLRIMDFGEAIGYGSRPARTSGSARGQQQKASASRT